MKFLRDFAIALPGVPSTENGNHTVLVHQTKHALTHRAFVSHDDYVTFGISGRQSMASGGVFAQSISMQSLDLNNWMGCASLCAVIS